MKPIILKILVGLFACCLLIGIIHQIYLKISFPYDTLVVYSSAIDKTASGNGVIFKDEIVLDYQNYDGVVRNLYSNGSRVAAKSEVAKIYKTQEDVLKMHKIDILEKEIASLKEDQSPGVLQDTNIKSIQKQINSRYYNLMTNIKSGNLTGVIDEKERITALFNKRQIITNQISDFNASINKLILEKKTIEESINSRPSSVKTPKSGYFVDSVDGYEESCSLNKANDITLDKIDDLFNLKTDSNINSGIGKIITNPKLLYKVSLPAKVVSDIKFKTECKIKFDEIGEEINATFEDVKIERDSDKALATFSIDIMTKRLSSLRKSKADIIFKTYEGINIPKTAVRSNDNGEVGVYTVNNMSMKFKKIDVLFEDENYLLCKINNEDTNEYVREYDNVIVKGRDLYDNKPIR